MNKSTDLYVFELDNQGGFIPIGEINNFTSLIWPEAFRGYSSFELIAPITTENNTLIKKNRILWCGGDSAAIIEIIEVNKGASGVREYQVKGRTLERYLMDRIVWGTYKCSNKSTSTAMYEIVTQNCISPSNPDRKIPFLECSPDEHLGKLITFQVTGGETYEALLRLATGADLGFNILFDPHQKKLIFKVYSGVDRSNPPGSLSLTPPVLFSTDLEDLIESSYYYNDQGSKTTAYVAGEGEGPERKHETIGNDSQGFDRRELYVDARDLQSSELGSADYPKALRDRGQEKLSECYVTETFEAQIRPVGSQYAYGVDYNKGDKVILQDTELGIQTTGVITEVTEYFGEFYQRDITFGYSLPTIIQRIKQKNY